MPGIGNQLIPVEITVEKDRIICQPLPPFATVDNNGNLTTNMPDGQYTIGVFENVKNTEGKFLRDAPVFHSFNVGANDTLPPRVVTTDPANGQQGVGAGLPPPSPNPGLPTESIAEVTTNVFGDVTPDITVRMSEGIRASSVNSGNMVVVDAGAFVPGGGMPPQLIPAPGFPKLKSVEDGATLPSNGHEILWRADPNGGGFPFGTQIQVTLLGLYNTKASHDADPAMAMPDNPSPLVDLAGNPMPMNNYDGTQDTTITFQTIAPPDLPANPLPEWSIWFSTRTAVGAIDAINHAGIAAGANPLPLNVLPMFTDRVASSQNIPNFDPFEIIVDPRHSVFGTCHTYVYVQSQREQPDRDRAFAATRFRWP